MQISHPPREVVRYRVFLTPNSLVLSVSADMRVASFPICENVLSFTAFLIVGKPCGIFSRVPRR